MQHVRTVWWGSVAAVLGSVTLGWYAQLVWRTWSWDPREDCAIQLSMPWEEVGVATSAFPPQLTCVGGDRVEFTNPLWTGQLLVACVAVVIVCALMALWYGREHRTEAPVLLLVISAVVAVLGVAGVVSAGDLRGHVENARDGIEPTARQTWQPGSTPTATSTPAVAVSAVEARAAMAELGRSARRAGSGVLWPRQPTITSAKCQDAGRAGTIFFLKARFTTRDMDDVHGPAEVLAVSRANEQVAARIVDAWLGGGLLSGAEPLHGEWHFAMPTDSPLDTAHIGFADSVGEVSVVSRCAVRS